MKNQKENNCLSLLNKLMSKKVAVRNTDGSTKEHQLFKNAAYNSNTGEVKIELDSGVKKVLFDDMPSPDITMKLNHRYSMPLAKNSSRSIANSYIYDNEIQYSLAGRNTVIRIKDAVKVEK